MFDNSVAIATFDGATSELCFDSTVTLEHFETMLPDYPLEEYAKTYPFSYSDDELPNLALALVHQYPSENVKHWVSAVSGPIWTNRHHAPASGHDARHTAGVHLCAAQ